MILVFYHVRIKSKQNDFFINKDKLFEYLVVVGLFFYICRILGTISGGRKNFKILTTPDPVAARREGVTPFRTHRTIPCLML